MARFSIAHHPFIITLCASILLMGSHDSKAREFHNNVDNVEFIAFNYFDLSTAANADIFYLRAQKLERLGIRAPFDADFEPLVSQAKSSFNRVERQNESAARRGKPLYCNVNDERMPPREVLRHLGRIPKSTRQKISLTRAFLMIAQKNYPCQ